MSVCDMQWLDGLINLVLNLVPSTRGSVPRCVTVVQTVLPRYEGTWIRRDAYHRDSTTIREVTGACTAFSMQYTVLEYDTVAKDLSRSST